MGRPRYWLKELARRSGFHVGSTKRFHLVERRFDSPVPDLGELPHDAFSRVDPLHGIDLEPRAHMDFAERELAAFIAEFDAPADPTGKPGEFYFRNTLYEAGDAELAYAFVRRFKPRRIVELGSGFSTLVLARALERNAGEGTYVVFDPDPPDHLTAGPPAALTELHEVRAQDVPPAEIAALGENDILFVDTSHAVKLGGDVNAIVLELLPLLGRGALAHFHDIWLPYEYHRTLVEEMGKSWAEQYLLQAFLAFNSDFEIVFATRAVARAEPERLQALIPAYTGANYPSSFWIRRTS